MGGTVTVIEGDHGSTYFHPDSADAGAAIACQVTLQRNASGDAMIGRRLYPLLAAAIVRRTFTAMIENVRKPAVAAGPISPERFDAGIRDLVRTAEPDGTFCYTFFEAVGRV